MRLSLCALPTRHPAGGVKRCSELKPFVSSTGGCQRAVASGQIVLIAARRHLTLHCIERVAKECNEAFSISLPLTSVSLGTIHECLQRMTTLPLTLATLLAIAAAVGQAIDDIDRYLDPFDPNPRFIVKNGHLMVMTGRNKDLLFRSSGTGSVKINGEDIAALAGGVVPLPDLPSSIRQLVDRRVELAEAKMDAMNATIQALKKRNSALPLRRLRNLTRRLTRLERLLNKNECSSSPCRNGGQCEDSFNKYFCRCPEGFTGTNCEQDVDECSHYQGTELGCQNGGTCLNTMGSFHCICPANFKGVRCTVEFNDCRNASNHEICGNGECFDLPRTASGVARYRCVCYQGFTKSIANSESAPCDADVDECAAGLHRCSKNPPVPCYNTHSGYTCGPCPPGFSGDGYSCVSADRCLTTNGGCSMSPRVSCFSDQNRVICGPCPPGFVGDGTVCSHIDGDICSANNGGCSPQARCRANPAISATYRDCLCPPGTTGSGIGVAGCLAVADDVSAMSCPSNPCQNSGTCMPYRTGIYCLCPTAFSGTFCEKPVNACLSNPCQNNGVCVPMQGRYSCICTFDFAGQNCEQPRSSCGGELDAEAGILAYPITNGTRYDHNLTCFWVIKNSQAEGKVLNITFTKFNLEFSNRCVLDFVELYDGPSRDYKSLGRFCGHQMPNKNGNFISSFNAVTLRFQSDISVGLDGFELNWITVDPTCGGLMSNLTHGQIESPGYPRHYPHRLDCHWLLEAPFGKRIQFVFMHLDLESSPNCTFDYLEFSEGGNPIMRYCNWTSSPEYSVPPPITTSSSFATVHFHSDAGLAGRGFQLMFHQVPGVCGGLLTGNSGIFTPPMRSTASGNLLYENNVACHWLIRAMPEERISLRFLTFDLEEGAFGMSGRRLRYNNSNCVHDYVKVYDGQAHGAPLMARLCGSITPPEMISSGRYMRVEFWSDAGIGRRGFTAQFKSLCGGEYEAATQPGMIKSPNYPAPILLSKNCTYVVRAPMGHVVKFEVEQMNIEFDHRCLFDYLLIDGRRYCGDTAPPPIYSMGSELEVVFVNDATKPSKGFRAQYESFEVGCGGVLKQGQPMVAITPEHLKENPFVQQCFWEIQANYSYIIVAKFFHTETPAENVNSPSSWKSRLPCTHNSSYILVNDTDGTLIKRFCARELPPPITSTGPKLFITYVWRSPANLSNVNNSANVALTSTLSPQALLHQVISASFSNILDAPVNHFFANYFFIKERNYCNRNLFASSGVIRSPRFPRRYRPNRNCTWVIHVDNGQQIKLNFSVFQLEPSGPGGVCYDYLEIRNGRRSDSPQIGKFCDNRPPAGILSHGNYLFLRFISDISSQYRGFELFYEATTTGCGGLMTGDSGSIESPDFPNSYYGNMNCEWQIRVSVGSVISLHIVEIKLEVDHGQCYFDYLEIFDGATDGAHSFGRVCQSEGSGSGNVGVFTSSTNTMFIRFTSDASVNKGGFKLNYRTLCNRTITGRYGVIESPNYPNTHPLNLNCSWHILGPAGNNLTIAFSALTLETSNDCTYDHVHIKQVNRERALQLSQADQISSPQNVFNMTTKKVLCGNFSGNLPAPIRLSTNEAVISFSSDATLSVASGFRLEWGAVGCGGEYIDLRRGTITSPGFPNPYPHDVECLWHIKAPEGRRVDLMVESLDLEYSKACNFDYVQVLGGPDENSPEITRLCNQASNMHISSVGNYMTIKMVSDISASRKGFKATFNTNSLGCGGRFTAESGTLTSPNYGRGNQYDAKSDCSYVIAADSHFDLQLTINDMHIPDRTANCSESYLAIYDAAGEMENNLLARVCGDMSQVSTQVLNSTNSALYLRFKADGASTGRGFNVTYRTVCGKTITVSDQEDFKIISSPNFPHLPSRKLSSCHFVVKAAKPSDTVTVRLTHVQAFKVFRHSARTSECAMSYLDFYEGKENLPKKRKLHFCSEAIPPPIISSGDTMLLVSHFTIFRALVSSVKSFCGGDFNAIEGYITNPGYPNSYPQNIECIWVLNASPGNRYTLEFDDFDLEQSDYCNGDYVEIRLGNSSGSLVGDRRLCGSGTDSLPSLEFAFAGDIWIKFRTDEVNVAKGFMLHFKIASNVMLSGNTGEVASPGFPNSFRFLNGTFTWSIAVPVNQFVKLTFEEMQLSDSIWCSVRVLIYDGLVAFGQMDPDALRRTMISPRIISVPDPKVTYCSSQIPPPFVSDSNVVSIVYTVRYVDPLPKQFHLKWSTINETERAAFDEHSEGIPGGVNSTFSVFVEKGQSFNLLHHNYTQYGNDINWYFTTRSSMHFNLSSSLVSFHTPSCWSNKFTIYSWLEESQKWNVIRRKLCKGFAGQMELSGTNQIRVHLEYELSNEIGTRKPRYNITIFPICGGTFIEPSGTIDTEDARDGHNSTQCGWLVKVRPGRTIQFTVEYFSIGFDTRRCLMDSLQIHNGHSKESPLLVRPLCGTNTTAFTLPETSGNVAYIFYDSSSIGNFHINNFRLHYREVGLECGGELVLHSMTDSVWIASPDYPESPSQDVTCEWIIRGPVSTGLYISLTGDLSRFGYMPCNKSNTYVEAFNGGTELARQLFSYCVPLSSPKSSSIDSHITLVRYVLRERDFKSKFNATIRPDNCHREYFISARQEVHQLESPVGGTTRCTLHLRTFLTHNLALRIKSINLQGSSCSSGDVIEFWDSLDSQVLVKRLCSTDSQNNTDQFIGSPRNELYIVYQRLNYQSNQKNVGITFNVRGKFKRCGKRINAVLHPTGTIRWPPSQPDEFQYPVYCSWILISDPGMVFKFHFDRFNLGPPPVLNISSSNDQCNSGLYVPTGDEGFRGKTTVYNCQHRPPLSDIITKNHAAHLSFSVSPAGLEPQEGFLLTYQTIYDNASCSSFNDLSHGQLVSAHFDNLSYTGMIDCIWEIKMKVNQSVTLLLDTLDVAGDCTNYSLYTVALSKSEAPRSSQGLNTCISRAMAPQSSGTKFHLPIFWRILDQINPSISFRFRRVVAGQSRGLRGEYFIQNCGGYYTSFNLKESMFTSPNYPNSYETNTFCNWAFISLRNYRLVFDEFDISDNCDEDFFYIYNADSDAPLKHKLCKHDAPLKPIYSNHYLLLSFVSSRDLSLSAAPGSSSSLSSPTRKFKFHLEKAAHGCGGTLLSTQGYFQSPNYDPQKDTFTASRQYNNNVECQWLIRALPEFHLELSFNSRFDIEESANCSNDYLLLEERRIEFVEDREVETWRVLKRLCGHKTPETITSETNIVRATFRTNDKVVGNGFRVDYRQECGGLFQGDSGIVNSPHYMEAAYGKGLTCVFRIQRAPHEYIRVTFDDFDLESSSNCNFDSVTIFLGDHTNASVASYGPYCGSTSPPSLSSPNIISIIFKTDVSVSKRGFKFHFAVDSCGGNITDSAGLIVSPLIRSTNYKYCIWQITVPDEQNSVAVRITQLELANENCRSECCNILKIYDGSFLGYGSQLLGQLCASEHDDLTFKSTNNVLTVFFQRFSFNRESSEVPKFQLEYWSTPGPKAGCGGTVRAYNVSAVISSPDIDGDSNYEPNLDCLWSISTMQLDTFVQLEFERFDVEEGNSSETCENDFLDVYDGTTIHAPLLAKLCGRISVPEKIQSTGESVLLHFVSNDNITGHGFRLRYSAQNRTCGGHIYASEERQQITSPNYPFGYSSPQQCVWTINAMNYRMPHILVFEELDLNCSRGDYVQLVETRDEYARTMPTTPITLCSSPGQLKVITSEQTSVVFKTDTVVHSESILYDNLQFGNRFAKAKELYRGFRLTYYSWLCNQTLDGYSGYVTNRKYPKADNIYTSLHCRIGISVPEDRHVALYFSSLTLYHCHHSNVTIFEGNSSLAKATYCNTQSPPSPFFSSVSNLTVVIRASYMTRSNDNAHSNFKINRLLYDFNFFSSLRSAGPPGCGGNLTGPRGVFSSPNYPEPLMEERVCLWLIHSNGYHTLTLKFDIFQLSSDCQNNYVIIYDGDEDVEQKKMATLCSSDKPAPIRSQSNSLLVKLVTVRNFEPGFLASYQVNTKEPKIRGRVISAQTFKYYKYRNTFAPTFY